MRIRITQYNIFDQLSGLYTVVVYNRARGYQRYHRCASGSPAMLARLLKPLRWATQKLRGSKRREAVDRLLSGYEIWRRTRA